MGLYWLAPIAHFGTGNYFSKKIKSRGREVVTRQPHKLETSLDACVGSNPTPATKF